MIPISEFADNQRLATNSERAEHLYLQAKEKASASCHPLKLGVELNLSVFYYEIKGDTKKAIDIAKETYSMIEGQLQDLQTGVGSDNTVKG
jgi:14-3-3 protein epsilon